MLAVSAERIYGLTGHGEGFAIRPGEVFAVLRRDEVETKVHERVGVRVLEIRDTGSAAALELETSRLGGWHGADVLRLLSWMYCPDRLFKARGRRVASDRGVGPVMNKRAVRSFRHTSPTNVCGQYS